MLTRIRIAIDVLFRIERFDSWLQSVIDSAYESGKTDEKRDSETWQQIEAKLRQKTELKNAVDSIQFK